MSCSYLRPNIKGTTLNKAHSKLVNINKKNGRNNWLKKTDVYSKSAAIGWYACSPAGKQDTQYGVVDRVMV